MQRIIEPAQRLQGVLKVPGDKSISHRALLLGVVSSGKQTIDGLSPSDDVRATLGVLRTLGCFVETMPDGRTLVLSSNVAPQATLDAGNSGTAARLVAGVVAGLDTTGTIDGDESLRRRPMTRVAEPLAAMGASITLAEGGHLPMTIRGGGLKGVHYPLPVASAQVKSAVLIAGLRASGETTVVESVPTRDHTEIMLREMGVDVRHTGAGGSAEITVTGGNPVRGAHISIPGDCSSAAYFAAAAACLPDSEICLPVTGVNPTRTGLLQILKRMGADIRLENEHRMSGEPVADLIVRPADHLRSTEVAEPALIVAAIDELPLLAVLATQAEGETVVRGAGELRVKESDRIAATLAGLSAMGADARELEDGFVVSGPTRLRGAKVSSRGDHRIAMALAVAGLLADAETTLDDASVVDVSYPGFFNDLRTLLP
jgi:3-phosphoshikimate 1-carboxyvinyltransferase